MLEHPELMRRANVWGVVALAVAVGLGALPGAVRADEDPVQTVIELVSNSDKDFRAVGLEQVREGFRGAETTKRFAGLLPKLSPPAQAGLLGALAERGDAAARPAVIEMIASNEPDVRLAAILALGMLGDQGDVPRLLGLLGDSASEKDAAAAIVRLHGAGVNTALVAATSSSPPALRSKVCGLLVARYATECVPALLDASRAEDAGLRAAALDALGRLASPEYVAQMLPLVLRAPNDAAREQAEKAIMFVSQRITETDKQADPLLAVMQPLGDADKTALLSALGRVGGPRALAVVEAALKDSDPARHAAGLRALCNWPNGSVAPKLYEVVRSAADESERRQALGALIRVAPLPDKRPDAQRLDMLQKAMPLCSEQRQQETILRRASAIRTMATLRFVASYLDDPKLQKIACETIVELAHHKELRQPHKAEFGPLLEKVMATSKDHTVVLRAQRYLEDRTWVEKQTGGK